MKRIDIILLVSFIALFIIAMALSSCGRASEGVAPPAEVVKAQTPEQIHLDEKMASRIKTEEVKLRPDTREISIAGKIQYNEDRLSKISSPVVGRATDIKAKLGDRVSAGQLLMTIESPDIASAYADFYKSRSDVAFAERGRRLAADLYETKAIAQKDLQQAQNDYLKAQAEFNRAKSRLLALRVPEETLEKQSDEPPPVQIVFSLKAPLSGTVIEKNVTLGQLVGADPAQNLYSVADLSTLYFVGEIFEKDIAQIHINQEILMRVDAYPGETFRGKIHYIGDLVDPASRTIKIRGEVGNPTGKLKPEMFARISVQTRGSKEIASIPQSAILREGEEEFVFLALPDSAFRRTRVTVGARIGADAQVTEGLKAGDRVVTEGGLLLKAMMTPDA